MTALDKLSAAWEALKAAGHDKIEDFTGLLDAESRRRFIAKICAEDGVDEAEAWRLIREDPKYSMGFKMCSPLIVAELTTKRGQAKFRQMLTPEEQEIWDTEVIGKINFSDAIKKEKKKQKAMKNERRRRCRGKEMVGRLYHAKGRKERHQLGWASLLDSPVRPHGERL